MLMISDGVRNAAAMCDTPVQLAINNAASRSNTPIAPRLVLPVQSTTGHAATSRTTRVMAASAAVPVTTTANPFSAQIFPNCAKCAGGH